MGFKSTLARILRSSALHYKRVRTIVECCLPRTMALCNAQYSLLAERQRPSSIPRSAPAAFHSAQWCVFNNCNLLGIKICQILAQQTVAHMKAWPFSKHTEILSWASGGCWSGQGFTRKNQQLLFGKQNYLYSWEKKTEVKVHLQNFWNQKVSEKQKCSSRNFEIWNIFFSNMKRSFVSLKNEDFLDYYF